MVTQIHSAILDIMAIANGMTGDHTPSNIANIALDKFTKVADEAEAMRAKARELSTIETELYETLNNSAKPFDRRTKAWRDHDQARKESNIAWMDFNNALRNIGLSVLDGDREIKSGQRQPTA